MERGHTSPADGLSVEVCPLLTLKLDLDTRLYGLGAGVCPFWTLKLDLDARLYGLGAGVWDLF